MWKITASKWLSEGQVEILATYLLDQRDLGVVRNLSEPVKDFYSIRALLETGLRVSEFCKLELADLRGKKLDVQRGKGGKPRTILLTTGTSRLLREWVAIRSNLFQGINSDCSPLFPSRLRGFQSTRAIQYRVKRVFQKCGLPKDLSAHSLRHTYCSQLIESGKVGLATVKENLGHHSITITNLYAHAAGDLGDLELYSSSTSHKRDKSEVDRACLQKRSKIIKGQH